MKYFNDEGFWLKTLREFDNAARMLTVWLIMKDGVIKGRITARWHKTRTYPIVHVAFIMYATENYSKAVFGYEKVQGLGFDMTNTGIANILNECRDELKEYCGVELNKVGWDIINTWRRDFENAGYSVLQAI